MSNMFTHDWNAVTGTATATIKYKETKFTGVAHCHPTDMDMSNEYTGYAIAEIRAMIKNLQYIKECEIKPGLAALKHLYNNIKSSKNYNSRHYEAHMLNRQIKIYESNLTDTINEIQLLRDNLKEYINLKDGFYKNIRKNRSNPNK